MNSPRIKPEALVPKTMAFSVSHHFPLLTLSIFFRCSNIPNKMLEQGQFITLLKWIFILAGGYPFWFLFFTFVPELRTLTELVKQTTSPPKGRAIASDQQVISIARSARDIISRGCDGNPVRTYIHIYIYNHILIYIYPLVISHSHGK